MNNLVPISIASITDTSQQRAISGRVYVKYYFITDGTNVFQHKYGTMQCNANIDVVNKIYPDWDVIHYHWLLCQIKLAQQFWEIKMSNIEESQKYTLKEIVDFPSKSAHYYFLHREYVLVFADKYIVCEYDAPMYYVSRESAEMKKAQMRSVLSSPEFIKVVYIQDKFVRM